MCAEIIYISDRQDAVSKVTMLNRRRLEELPGVDVKTEESQGRLLQHIEDLDAISDDAFRQLCTGAHVFFNTLGTTRSIAGSAVSDTVLDYKLTYNMHENFKQQTKYIL